MERRTPIVISGLISGLVTQSELTELLDELYADPANRHALLEKLYRSHDLTSPDEAGEHMSPPFYREVASIFG